MAVPLVFVAYYAFTDESFRFTAENLTKFFTAVSTITDDSGATREVHTYLLIFWRSVKLAVISTAICLLMGYPIAYIIARAAPRTQKTIITLIMIPMWMNFLIRTYAWMTILQDTGLLNMLFSALHLGQAHIIGTEGAVVVGMVYDYFPYMILPIYSVMAKMDTRLIEAARDLGASPARVLKDITLPLVFPAVLSGMMLSAAMSLDDVVISFFVTSAETTTLPLKVYTGLRSGGTPEINALSTLMLGVIFICVAATQLITARSNAKLQ